MSDSRPDAPLDLIDRIPDPDTVRGWLAESVRCANLLRSLLRVALRKAAYRRPPSGAKEADRCRA